MNEKTLPKISSFAAPTEADLKAFAALSDDEKRALLAEEIEKGANGPARKVTADDIIRRGKARHGLKDGRIHCFGRG